MLARIQAEVADYRRLPVEELAGDIAGITRQAVRAFARSLREDRELNAAELRQIGASAVRRAEEGFPLEAVLTAYHVGAREIFAVGSADAGSADVADLLDVADRVLAFVGTVTGAVTRGYLEELRTKVGQEHTARRTLLSVLADGGPVDVVARSAGIALPARYLVLSVELGPHADEASPGVDAEIAVRRKLRRFLAAFERSCGDGVLASLDGPGGLVLLPAGRTAVVRGGVARAARRGRARGGRRRPGRGRAGGARGGPRGGGADRRGAGRPAVVRPSAGPVPPRRRPGRVPADPPGRGPRPARGGARAAGRAPGAGRDPLDVPGAGHEPPPHGGPPCTSTPTRSTTASAASAT